MDPDLKHLVYAPETPAVPPGADGFVRLRRFLFDLYFGDTPNARAFQIGLLAFDIATLVYFVVSSFWSEIDRFYALDLGLAAVLAAELILRLISVSHAPQRVLQPATISDLIVIISLVAPTFGQNLAFLRVVRMLRLLRSYHLLRRLRLHSVWFRRHEDLIQSALNLIIFIFVVSAVVFVVEGHRNPNISNYFDALYFTVTTLTTTGFGDITMTDTPGRVLAVLIMVFGVTLFLRLIQIIFRPPKAHFACPRCGLSRHDPDAVHCKHCGEVVNIPTEGEWT